MSCTVCPTTAQRKLYKCDPIGMAMVVKVVVAVPYQTYETANNRARKRIGAGQAGAAFHADV